MEVGKIISNNEAISGTRFFLGCDYYSHFFDESTNSILLLLRYRDNNSNDYTHTGYIAEFDLANEKMIWSRKVNKFSWIPGQGFCFINSKNMVYSVNRVNGTNLWSKEGNIVFKKQFILF
jgi:outer membrane protein assembly factor BamB